MWWRGRTWSPAAVSPGMASRGGPQALEVAGDKEGPPAHTGALGPPCFWTSGLQAWGAVPFCCFSAASPTPRVWSFVAAVLGSEYKVLAAPAGPRAWPGRLTLASALPHSPVLASPGLDSKSTCPFREQQPQSSQAGVSEPKGHMGAVMGTSPCPGIPSPEHARRKSFTEQTPSTFAAPSCLWALPPEFPKHQAWAVGGFDLNNRLNWESQGSWPWPSQIQGLNVRWF